MNEIPVIFQTDEYRGDHAADVEIVMSFSQHLTINQLLAEAERLKTYKGLRATIKILPDPPEDTP